ILLTCWLVYINLDNDAGHKYKSQIQNLQSKILASNYNDSYVFLVDFSIPSGKKRMFLYNLYTGELEKSFMVAHGEGCGQEGGSPVSFSNVPNSLCSSEGLAVIGEKDYSNY